MFAVVAKELRTLHGESELEIAVRVAFVHAVDVGQWQAEVDGVVDAVAQQPFVGDDSFRVMACRDGFVWLGDDAPVNLHATLHRIARPLLLFLIPRQRRQQSARAGESQLHMKCVAIDAQVGITVLGNDMQCVVLQLMIAEADTLRFVVHNGGALAVATLFVAQVVVVEGLHLDGLFQAVKLDGECRVEGVDIFLVVLVVIGRGERDGQQAGLRLLPMLPRHHFCLLNAIWQRFAHFLATHA